MSSKKRQLLDEDTETRDSGSSLYDPILIEAAAAGWLSPTSNGQFFNGMPSAALIDDYAGNTTTRGAISVGQSVMGEIETTGDSDWFRIALTAGHTYRFNLQGRDSGQGTLRDPYLELYDSDGDWITYNDDGVGTGLDSQFTFTASSSGTYYLSAEAWWLTGTTGSYRLSASEEITTDTTFDIVIDYSGNPLYQSLFDAAAQRWEQIITADLPDVTSFRHGRIDDLLIDASVFWIDGPSGTLAQATPDEFLRGPFDASLPNFGYMDFDSADIQELYDDGTLLGVILHEIGHVLGIGTLWDGFGLLNGFNYTGTNALAEYRALVGSANGIPVEDVGGSGSVLSHWRETVFDTELMTSIAEAAGVLTPISRMTIASLDDLGYTVNLAAADPYPSGDDQNDILFQHANTGAVGYWRMSNGVSTGWVGLGGSNPAYQIVGVGDLSGDGASDILFQDVNAGAVGYWLMSSGVSTGWVGLGGSNPAYQIVGTGDLSGDSASEILFQDVNAGAVGYWRMSNGIATGWVGLGGSNPAYRVVGASDLSGDGASDILFQDVNPGAVGYWRMSNGVSTGWVGLGGSNPAYHVVGTTDLSGDGALEIVFQDVNTGAVGYWRMSNGIATGWVGLGGSNPAYQIVGDLKPSDTSFTFSDISASAFSADSVTAGPTPLGAAPTAFGSIEALYLPVLTTDDQR